MTTAASAKRALSTSHARRLENAERDIRDHAKSISEITNHLSDLTNRYGELAARTTAIETARAQRAMLEARMEEREDARDKAMEQRFTYIEKKLDNIYKLGWIVVSTFVGALALWVLKGGLAG